MTNSRTTHPVPIRLTRLAACFSVMFGVSNEAMATNVTDCTDGGGANTLRKIVANAASGDIISVSQCSLITLSNGELSSSKANVRIQGNGSNVISGNNTNRIIKHTGTGGYLAFHDVTLQDGRYVGLSALGGCIYSTSPNVRLYNTTVKNCSATETDISGNARGAGIYALGHVEMRDSTVTGNTATQQSTGIFHAEGGGIYADSVSAFNSTISNNTTQSTAGIASSEYTQGGGIFANSAVIYSSTLSNNSAGKYGAMKLGGGVNMVDSTISGNSAVHRTGGLGLQGASTIANSTIAFNSSSEAFGPAGVRTTSALNLQSTIIANSTYGSVAAKDVGGSGSIDPASANNLIMSSQFAVPTDTIHEDPHLLPLANNGGQTRTHALNQDSPAIDRGNAVFNYSNFVPVLCDQRGNPGHELNPPNTYNCSAGSGYVRTDTDPLHSKPDIGAFEVQFPIADWIFFDGFGF